MKANPDKFHLILSDSSNEYTMKVDKFHIHNSNSRKLLGIKVDNKLSFNDHVSEMCAKASQKLHALSRVSKFMTLKQRKSTMRAFIMSQFGYRPLVWMFHSRQLNNRINKIHERALRIVYRSSTSGTSKKLELRCIKLHTA